MVVLLLQAAPKREITAAKRGALVHLIARQHDVERPAATGCNDRAGTWRALQRRMAAEGVARMPTPRVQAITRRTARW